MSLAEVSSIMEEIFSAHMTELCLVLRTIMCDTATFQSDGFQHTGATGQALHAVIDKEVERLENRITRLSSTLATRLNRLEEQVGIRLEALERTHPDNASLIAQQRSLKQNFQAERIDKHQVRHDTSIDKPSPSPVDIYCRSSDGQIRNRDATLDRERINTLRKEALLLTHFSRARNPALPIYPVPPQTLSTKTLPPLKRFESSDFSSCFGVVRKKVAHKSTSGKAPASSDSVPPSKLSRKRSSSDSSGPEGPRKNPRTDSS
jgi:hypothetical protein